MPIVVWSSPLGEANSAGSPLANAESSTEVENMAGVVEGKSAWMPLPPNDASNPPERSPSPMAPLPRMVCCGVEKCVCVRARKRVNKVGGRGVSGFVVHFGGLQREIQHNRPRKIPRLKTRHRPYGIPR